MASNDDSGVQIIDITEPSDPIAVSAAKEGQVFTELSGARSITTITIDSSHYAIVASGTDQGVQIIDITEPDAISAASSFSYSSLIDAESVTTATLGSSTYVLVASSYSAGSQKNGVQIVDITEISSPTRVSNIFDGAGGYTALLGARSITTTTTIDSSTYALVAARTDNAVQIMHPSCHLRIAIQILNTQSRRYIASGSTNNAIASDTPQFMNPPKIHLYPRCYYHNAVL